MTAHFQGANDPIFVKSVAPVSPAVINFSVFMQSFVLLLGCAAMQVEQRMFKLETLQDLSGLNRFGGI